MPLTPAQERRTVTVLFARADDLERASAEEADAAYAIFRGAVEGHGGTVDKFFGAEFMAVFGAPVAHEDDPARAVRAALEIVDAARSRALAVHAGLNCGEVLWGRVAGDRPTAMGDPVNVAHRLMEAAPPGLVLVSRAVERACRGEMLFRSPEKLELRGRVAGVEALEAWRAPSGPTEARLSPLPSTPFLGRDDELARVLEIVSRAGGGAVLVRGEAGTGKSRILSELRRALRSKSPGLRSMTGRARDAVRLPLLPFREIVTAELGAPGLELFDPVTTAARLKADLVGAGIAARDASHRADFIVLSLGAALPDSPVRHLDPLRAAEEARAAWADWFASRAIQAPLLVGLEDLHWADGATLALAEHLARALPGRNVSVVASARPEARVLAGFTDVLVRELPPAAAAGIARTVLGGDLAPALERWLLEKSGGNPLFIEELCAWLRDQGLVKGPPFELAAAPSRIPDGLQALLVARLDTLPAAEREALKAASVLGRVFGAKLLSAIAGAEALAAAGGAVKRGLILPQDRSLLPGDMEYAFRHALFRDAAYSLLAKKDRARFHGRAADAFLAVSPGRALTAMAARHREAQGRAADAAALWLRVAEEASQAAMNLESADAAVEAIRLGLGGRALVLAAGSSLALARFAEAETFARKALEGDPADFRSRLHLARATFSLGRPEESLADLKLVADGAAPALRAEALITRAEILCRMGRSQEAAGPAAEAEAALQEGAGVPEPGRSLLRCSLGSALGQISMAKGSYSEALSHFSTFLESSRALGNRGKELIAQGNLGIAFYNLGRLEEAQRAFGLTLEGFREIGDRRAVAASLNNQAIIRRRDGDPAGAERFLREALALNREIGYIAGALSALENLAQIALDRGDLDGAESMIRRCLAEAEQTASARERNSAIGFLGSVSLAHGRLDEAEKFFEECDAEALQRGEKVVSAVARVDRAGCRLLRGDLGAAEALAREACRALHESGQPFGEARGLTVLAETAEAGGRMDEAEKFAADAAAIWLRVADPEFTASIAVLRSRLALSRGDLAEARRRLEAAPREGEWHEFLILRFAQARLLAAEGRKAEALAALEAASHDPSRNRFHAVDRLHSIFLEARTLRDAEDAAGAGRALDAGAALVASTGMKLWQARLLGRSG